MSMNEKRIIFPSEEWVEKYVDALNNNPTYEQAAKTWEGDFLFIIEPDGTGTLTETVTLYCDLWHGKCRKAFIVTPETGTPEAEYEYSGPYSNWIRMFRGEIGPIKGLLARQFKLKGNMAKVLKAVKAAQELVRTTTLIKNIKYL